MTKIALVVGSAEYDFEGQLPCCDADADAIHNLIEATDKYDIVKLIKNTNSEDLKAKLRDVLDAAKAVEEIFFYFSGHGCQIRDEFFFCPKNFDSKKPFETGLSSDELHTLFRGVSPGLVVKVVDACNSGTHLIKSADGFLPPIKGALSDVIQIASCLNSQESLTGEPLSEFTEKFCHAILTKKEGPIYYTDITNAIRDGYINNESQIPHFTAQGTGREVFIDEARKLSSFKSVFEQRWNSIKSYAELSGDSENTSNEVIVVEDVPREPTLLELLKTAEEKVAKPDQMYDFVDRLFDGVIKKLSSGEFAEYFASQVVEHQDYSEINVRPFIIRVLSNQPRSDKFVSASIITKRRARNIFEMPSVIASQLMEPDPETWELELNCNMKRAQIKVSLTPRYVKLQKLALVISCAPSIDTCYVFENITQHARTDWSDFEFNGKELVQRWYKMKWTDDTDWLVIKITDTVRDTVASYLGQTKNQLSKD